MNYTTQPIEEKVKKFEMETVASIEQLSERQRILDVYVNLFRDGVHKKVSGATIESIIEDLMERHNKLLPLATDDVDTILSDLSVIEKFDKLFELREVKEIVEQIKCVNDAISSHLRLLVNVKERELQRIIEDYSLDTTKFEEQYPHFFNTKKYLN